MDPAAPAPPSRTDRGRVVPRLDRRVLDPLRSSADSDDALIKLADFGLSKLYSTEVLRYCLCLVFPLPSRLRQRLSLRTSGRDDVHAMRHSRVRASPPHPTPILQGRTAGSDELQKCPQLSWTMLTLHLDSPLTLSHNNRDNPPRARRDLGWRSCLRSRSNRSA